MSALDDGLDAITTWGEAWRKKDIQDNACAELAAMRARIAELEAQSATLTPRRCSRECYLRGWQAAQEAAADMARGHHGGEVFKSGSEQYNKACLQIESAIRALQPPADCGCNPLYPSEHDAAMLDEWHKRM